MDGRAHGLVLDRMGTLLRKGRRSRDTDEQVWETIRSCFGVTVSCSMGNATEFGYAT